MDSYTVRLRKSRDIWACFSDHFNHVIVVSLTGREKQAKHDQTRCLTRDHFQVDWCSASLTAHGSGSIRTGSVVIDKGRSAQVGDLQVEPYLLLIALIGTTHWQGSNLSWEYSPIPHGSTCAQPRQGAAGGFEAAGFSPEFSPQTLESYHSSFSSTSTHRNHDDRTRWRQRDCL